MNHIKNNWLDTDTFHAHDLNEIASVVNELSERQGSIINNEETKLDSTYSSNKIVETIGGAQGRIINDGQSSGDSAYSSSKVDEDVEIASFKAIVVDSLPEVGEPNAIYFTPSKNVVQPVESGCCEMYLEQNSIILNPSSDMESISEFGSIEVGDVFRYNKPSGIEYDRVVLADIDKSGVLVDGSGDSRDGLKVIADKGTLTLQNGHYYRVKDKYLLKGANSYGELTFSFFSYGYGLEYLAYEEVSNPGEGNYRSVDFFPGAIILEGVLYRDFCSSDYPMVSIDSGMTKNNYHLIPVEGFNDGLRRSLRVGDTIKITGENTGYSGYPFVCVTQVIDDILAMADGSGDERGMFDGIISSKEWQIGEFYRFTGLHTILTEPQSPSDDLVPMYTIPTFEQVTDIEEADYEASALPGVIIRQGRHSQIKDKWIWVDNDWMLLSGPSDESN
jgi:hypothetical protein